MRTKNLIEKETLLLSDMGEKGILRIMNGKA